MDEAVKYVDLPPGVRVLALVQMVCPHGHIHHYSVDFEKLYEHGILAQIEDLRASMREEGHRDPTPADYEAAMQKASEAAAMADFAAGTRRYDA